MSSKTKTSSYVDELIITKRDYERILMWSLSKREINFVCLGKGKVVESVFRLSNISSSAENYSCWSESERKMLIKEKKRPGQIVLAWGHSHPKKYHEQHPSSVDLKYIPKGRIELIAFPLKDIVRAWIIFKSMKKTLKSEIWLRVEESK